MAENYDAFVKPIKPINDLTTTQLKQIALGKTLFGDHNLSQDKKMACTTCHIPSKGYADGLPFSKDNTGLEKEYNTPSISYSIYNYYHTWTGRFSNLQTHLDFLMTNKTLMNRDWPSLTSQLKNDKTYPQLFKQSGYDEISKASITDAIVKFEASLARPARFDLYLLGDKTQLSAQEIRGYSLFKESGCVSCHQGVNLGGNLKQRFGVMKPYFKDKKGRKRDLGYFNTSKNKDDINFFRVPSLRNVTLTAPYFHDASAQTLEEAIEIMFTYQLGVNATKQDVEDIKSFLSSLEAPK